MKGNYSINNSRLNMSRADLNNNDRMQRLGEKLSKITVTLILYRSPWITRRAQSMNNMNTKF